MPGRQTARGIRVSQSSVDLAAVTQLVLAWPEQHAALGMSSALDTILAEAINAQRIILTADAAALGDFLERHARRAPLQQAADAPGEPTGSVHYAITSYGRLSTSIRDALEVLDPATAFVWDPIADRDLGMTIRDPWVNIGSRIDTGPVQLAIAADLPSAEALAELTHISEEVLVLVRPSQFPYLQRLVQRVRALRLPGEIDRTHDRTQQFRGDVRRRIHESVHDAELMVLAPLFDEFDPAVVAAAILLDPPRPWMHGLDFAQMHKLLSVHARTRKREDRSISSRKVQCAGGSVRSYSEYRGCAGQHCPGCHGR